MCSPEQNYFLRYAMRYHPVYYKKIPRLSKYCLHYTQCAVITFQSTYRYVCSIISLTAQHVLNYVPQYKLVSKCTKLRFGKVNDTKKKVLPIYKEDHSDSGFSIIIFGQCIDDFLTFSNSSCMFLNPNNFSSLNSKLRFFLQCSKMQLIPLKNFIIKICFVQFL